MPFSAVYDASVLYSSTVRDLLIRVAQAGLVQARWSERILDECFDSILRNRRDLDRAALARTRELMSAALRDADVLGYERLEQALDLPDPDDRHVLAAAIRAGAQVIVTKNLQDFPTATLAEFDIEAQDPDLFVLNIIELDGERVASILADMAADRTHSRPSVDDVLGQLEKEGLVRSSGELRRVRAALGL